MKYRGYFFLVSTLSSFFDLVDLVIGGGDGAFFVAAFFGGIY
jgi:hypothetical protein